MLLRQRLAVHLVAEEHVLAPRVVDVQAAGEILRVILLADFLHLLIRAEEHHLDAALERRALVEQRGQRRARPAHVANRAHETGAVAVAAALQRGRDGLALALLNLIERQRPALAHQAADFQGVPLGLQGGHVVMRDYIKVFTLGAPVRQFRPARLPAHVGLRVEEGNQHAFVHLRPAEQRERILDEREGGGGDAGLEHVAAIEAG